MSSNSRDRSMSPRRENSRPPNFQNDYPSASGFPGDFSAQPGYQAPYSNATQYPNYDYQVPMIPPVPNSYPTQFSAPPPPVGIGDFQNTWNNPVPPPPVISTNEPKPAEIDEEKQKREGLYFTNFENIFSIFNILID